MSALLTVYAGLELYKWILIIAALVVMGVGFVKKLFKLAVTAIAIAVIYLVLSHLGILPF